MFGKKNEEVQKKEGVAFSISPLQPKPPAVVIQPATRRGRGLCRVNPPSRVISKCLGHAPTSRVACASGRPPRRSGWAPTGGILRGRVVEGK